MERELTTNNKPLKGIEISLPNTTLVMITGSKGYIMCGYLNIEAAEKFKDCAAIIKGVKNIDDMLKGKIVALTSFAQNLGLKIGMTGQEASSLIA